MATVDELLAAEETENSDELSFIIDEHMRIITVPERGVVLGVEGDKDVNRVRFRMNRYYHGSDLSAFETRINYQNADGDVNYFPVAEKTVDTDTFSFIWTVAADAVKTKGTVFFVVNCIKEDTDGTVQKAYHTTLGTATVLQGLDVDAEGSMPEIVDLVTRLTVCARNAEASEKNAAASEKNAKASEEATAKALKDAKAIVGTDKTLTVDGAAADAKAVGERLDSINVDLPDGLLSSGSYDTLVDTSGASVKTLRLTQGTSGYDATDIYSKSACILLDGAEGITIDGGGDGLPTLYFNEMGYNSAKIGVEYSDLIFTSSGFGIYFGTTDYPRACYIQPQSGNTGYFSGQAQSAVNAITLNGVPNIYGGICSYGTGWVRFTNGTQICWGTSSTINTTPVLVTFSAAFSKIPSIMTTPNTAIAYPVCVSTASCTGFQYRVTSTSAASTSASVFWFAIGTWN